MPFMAHFKQVEKSLKRVTPDVFNSGKKITYLITNLIIIFTIDDRLLRAFLIQAHGIAPMIIILSLSLALPSSTSNHGSVNTSRRRQRYRRK